MSSPPSNKPSEPAHAARAFHNYPGAAYVLPSDEPEAKRLALQHNIWKTAFEDRVLLPPFNSQSSYFVLDSGTGPASFLLDIAPQLSPTSILHGIDIQSLLFPSSRPSNISFSIASITSLPDGWTNKFDFVHQRLLIGGLQRDDWPRAIGEIFRVLSPGGWVQLGELDVCSPTVGLVGPVGEKVDRMQRALAKFRNLNIEIYAELPELLRQAKFTEVRLEKRSVPIGAWAGQYGVGSRNNLGAAYRAMKTVVLKAGGFGVVETEEEFDQMIDDLERGWDETEGCTMTAYITYAQRPAL